MIEREAAESLSTSNARPVYDGVLILTLIMFLRYAFKQGDVGLPVMGLVAAAIFDFRVRQSTRLWWILTSIFAIWISFHWWRLDNHIYLMGYWCLAVALAMQFGRERRAELLAVNSILLIAACMLLAAFQKLASSGYRSGEFFQFALLADWRFENLGWYLGGVARGDLAANRLLVDSLKSAAIEAPVSLIGSEVCDSLARVMTVWTVVIEGTIGLVFSLFRSAGLWAVARSWLLIGFIVTTYPVASVIGFAWVLIVLGYAQVPERSTKTRWVFVILFVAMSVFEIPPSHWLSWLFG